MQPIVVCKEKNPLKNKFVETKNHIIKGAFCIFNALFSSTAEEANETFPFDSKGCEAKFQFGEILINQRERIVEFNATCNQNNGLIEYALVHETGKPMSHFLEPKFALKFYTHHFCFLNNRLSLDFSKIYGLKNQEN